MSFDRDKTYSGWACVDCLFLLANGDKPAHMTADEVADYLARVDQQTEGCEVTLGMFAEDHACATNYTVTWHARSAVRGSYRRGTVEVRADSHEDAVWEARCAYGVPAGAWAVLASPHELETESARGGECECEQDTFSWSACDVCGSNLGGSRDAVVFWFRPVSPPVTAYVPGSPNGPDAAEPVPGLHTDPQADCAACAAEGISAEDHAGIMGLAAMIRADAQAIQEMADRVVREAAERSGQ